MDMIFLLKAAGIAGTLYAAFTLFMVVTQRQLLYLPDSQRLAPATAGLLALTERELATPDGARLITWRAAAEPGKPTLLYFHGNGGHLMGRAERFHRFTQEGWGVLAFGYRGYSGSSGRPSEAAIVADAKLAYDALRAEGVPAQAIVLFGESLGTGVAVQVAAERAVAGVVLDAPYTSLTDVAAQHYWYLPVRLLMFDRFESMRYIDRVQAPLLILHGEKDDVIPAAMGRALHAAAPHPKRLVTYPTGTHLDLLPLGGWEEVRRFVAGLEGGARSVVPAEAGPHDAAPQAGR